MPTPTLKIALPSLEEMEMNTTLPSVCTPTRPDFRPKWLPPSIRLNNGIRMPLVGYGTALLGAGDDTDKLKTGLRVALANGYRLIDTAFVYKTEPVIGEVLSEVFAEGLLTRKDVFISTKLPSYAHSAQDVFDYVERQLADLKTDYIDVYYIHTACPSERAPGKDAILYDDEGYVVEADIDHVETWRALEILYKQGKIRALGLSNFSEDQIIRILRHCTVRPQVLQAEVHALFPQWDLHSFCRKHRIALTAYGPLGNPGMFGATDVLNHPKVRDIADKYDKTPAQVLLRNLHQRGIGVIPKSVTPSRIVQNADIYDFHLTDDDVRTLTNLGPHNRLFVYKHRFNHSQYPFSDVPEARVNQKKNIEIVAEQ